jgi:predicted ATPase
MKLVDAHVTGYRGLKNVDIPNCGVFNVLIGKNNAGKSSVLYALSEFFKMLGKGSIVNTAPTIGKPNDFSGLDSSHKLTFTCTFSLDESELSSLAGDIVKERAQLQTVVDAFPKKCLLSVCISINPPPEHFSYVSRVVLQDDVGGGRSHTLLELNLNAATEIYALVRDIEAADRDIPSIKSLTTSFEANDWKMAKEGGAHRILNMLPRRMMANNEDEISRELSSSIQRLMNDSTSHNQFVASLKDKQDELEKKKSNADAELKIPVKTFSGEEKRIPSYITSLLAKVAEIKVLFLTERRSPIGVDEAQKILNLKTQRGGDKTLKNIQETVSELLGVSVDAFTQEPSARERYTSVRERNPRGNAELDVDNFLVEVNGSGIREALRLILDTAFEKPTLLLVEEPEIHLHPALETSMMRFLQGLSEECQVFITTHSTNFIDRGDYQNIYLVTKSDYTNVKLLAYPEAEKRIPQELGIRLSSLFMYDYLLFVEGASDELVIRELSKILDVRINQKNVGFLPLHGIGNISHYAAKETLAFLANRQVKLFFFVDRDERTKQDIEAMRTRLGADAILFPTRFREIESYLFSSKANVQYIRSIAPKTAENLPDEAKFEEDLNTCADGLKNHVIWKKIVSKMRPIYPEREHNSDSLQVDEIAPTITSNLKEAVEKITKFTSKLPELVRSMTEEVEGQWEREKFNLVPGAILLDEVYKKYALRFEKMRDAPRLASHMSETEIDSELKSFLKGLDTFAASRL